MAVYSAIPGTGPRKTGRRERRASKPGSEPLRDRAKFLADVLYERAKNLAETLAPEVPADAEPLDPYDQWNILEAAAAAFSPAYWDEPEALDDLYKLRKQFMGVDDEQLKALAKEAKQRKRFTPDLSITPASPEFAKQARRMGVAS